MIASITDLLIDGYIVICFNQHIREKQNSIQDEQHFYTWNALLISVASIQHISNITLNPQLYQFKHSVFIYSVQTVLFIILTCVINLNHLETEKDKGENVSKTTWLNMPQENVHVKITMESDDVIEKVEIEDKTKYLSCHEITSIILNLC